MNWGKAASVKGLHQMRRATQEPRTLSAAM
jgi:hypothetical protein